MFVRYIVSGLGEEPVGIFHAVRYLRDDGMLTEEQEEIANKVFDWLYDHMDAPAEEILARHGRAISWFRATAASHIAQADKLVSIVEAHGYKVTATRRLDPGVVIYSDSSQVLVLPVES